jgi:FAD dependent oxidoreductase
VKHRIAIAGAGIYGTTTAIRLAEQGQDVTLFDPLGIIRAASAINAGRVHKGYHYPRSPETIAEVLEASSEFLKEFGAAIVGNCRNYYAIPWMHSWTSVADFEAKMGQANLPLKSCRPEWMNFEYIQACYEVDEQVYDADVLRTIMETRVRSTGVKFRQQAFAPEMRGEYDFLVWATYGLGPSSRLFSSLKLKVQVAEKALIELTPRLHGLAVVIIDGPFTAFDPYGNSGFAMFGSAKHTNHWSTRDPDEPIPELYRRILNASSFEPVEFTRFEDMRADCSLAIPDSKEAIYRGSRFTLRVVEDSPVQDRRTLYVVKGKPGEFHIFSGKVVSAVMAARMICEAIEIES